MATAEGNELGTRLTDGPLIDHHCHTFVRGWRTVSGAPPDVAAGWRRCFTEAVRRPSLDRDVPAMRGYREFLGAIGRYLGLDPSDGVADESAVTRARDAQARAEEYAADLLDASGVTMLLVDTGYGGAGWLGVGELERVTGRPVRTIARVESIAERTLAAGGAPSPARFRDAVLTGIEAELDAGAVGLKTIAAYRSGLDLVEPTTGAVRHALLDRTGQARRLNAPALVSVVARTALAVGHARGIPVQVHTGFGDEDVDLALADPTHLRPVLRDPALERCPVVLLHGYPFVAQAAYLASIFPQVHLDLSLAIPLLGAGGARGVIAEALRLCPTTKLLAGSDGHSYPEMHWRGASLWREGLEAVLRREVEAGRMAVAEAASVASDMLAGNARRLYRLDAPRDAR